MLGSLEEVLEIKGLQWFAIHLNIRYIFVLFLEFCY
jgi:hypothetical protein